MPAIIKKQEPETPAAVEGRMRANLHRLYDESVRCRRLLDFELLLLHRLRASREERFRRCGLGGPSQLCDTASSPHPSPPGEERERRPEEPGGVRKAAADIVSAHSQPTMRALTSICVGGFLAAVSGVASAQQTQWVVLPAPVHTPISWQGSTNGAAARPAPPSGLSVVGRPSPSELSEFVGAWNREKNGAGELRSFVLEREGALTAVFGGEKTNRIAKGKWELKDAAIHFQFTSQTERVSIPAVRETKLFIVREAAGIVLVGEERARFVRPK